MSGQPLVERHCTEVLPTTPPLSVEKAHVFFKELSGWELAQENTLIRKQFRCKDFKEAVALLERIANLAEANNHHPDLHLTNYRNLTVDLSTHSIKGLSDNDFILAAKLDRILSNASPIR